MRKRLRKKLIGFSPSWWKYMRENEKRDKRESRFIVTPFFCSESVTSSMNDFFLKKKQNQILKKSFRSKRKAVEYTLVLSNERYKILLDRWYRNCQEQIEENTYLKYRYK